MDEIALEPLEAHRMSRSWEVERLTQADVHKDFDSPPKRGGIR
jgi:hypothetical protein